MTMDKETQDRIIRDRVEMVTSLVLAINAAGGSAPSFEELKEMTFQDMLEIFAQNGIRFYYKKPKMVKLPGVPC